MRMENKSQPLEDTATKPKGEETMDDTVEHIMNFSVASNMTSRINAGTPNAPVIRQVQAGTAASVASSVTVSAKKGSSISSVHTPQSHSQKGVVVVKTEANPITPNPKTKQIEKTHKTAHEEINKTVYATETGHTFDLGTMPESDDTLLDTTAERHDDIQTVTDNSVIIISKPNPEKKVLNENIHKVSTVQQEQDTGTQGFIKVLDGAKTRSRIKPVSAQETRSQNSFAILDDMDNNEHDQTSEKLVDSDRNSLDLLVPNVTNTATRKKKIFTAIRDNIATTPQKQHKNNIEPAIAANEQTTVRKPTTEDDDIATTPQNLNKNIIKSTGFVVEPTTDATTHITSVTKEPAQKKKIKIPDVLNISDTKLRMQPYAMEQIEAKLLKNCHHEISLNDLVWYITQSKPRAGHIKAQLNQDCIGIQRTATKEFRQACNEAVDFTQVGLAKMATIECNKLKIMIEKKKANDVYEKLKSLHSMCTTVVTAMSTQSSGHATKHDLAADVLKLNTRIDSKADHLQQLLHPIKKAVDSMQQGLAPMEIELNTLKRTVEQLKQNNSQTPPVEQTTHGDNTFLINKLRALKQRCSDMSTTVELQTMEIQPLKKQLQEQAKESVTQREFHIHKEEVQ